jgi:hypothetical protein
MTSYNAYEKLFNNMKNGLTVVNDNGEYSLGDYMLMKAGKQKEISTLPAQRTDSSSQRAITALFSYVNEKLAVKEPPAKDKIIKSFPLRTSAAALLSAVLACTLVLTYGATAANSKDIATSLTLEANNEDTEANAENNAVAFEYSEN